MTQSAHVRNSVCPETTPVLLESRHPIPEITTYLKSVICTIKSLNYEIDHALDSKILFERLSSDLPDSPIQNVKDVFIHDIVRLGSLFFDMTKQSHVKLHILPVNSNMCRLFHEDYYRQRLLCTYLGPGTEWLDHNNVNRAGLGKGRNQNIVKDASKINRANTFDVILLKGARHESGMGVVHRSPPVEHTGQIRILLKIDE